MKILLTGATGLVGRPLGVELVKNGHQVVVVSRNSEKSKNSVPFPAIHLEWSDVDNGAATEIDAVIHLAGESIASGLWTKSKREKILKSRVDSTTRLVASFGKSKNWPKIWINASAIGFYGNCGSELLTEESTPGTGFLASVCQKWEMALAAVPKTTRVVRLRTGLVLSKNGGILEAMVGPFKLGLGARLASGQQWMSWIHEEDLLALIIFALNQDSVVGALNAVSPGPVTNLAFSQVLAKVCSRPMLLCVPRVLLELLGECSSLALYSQRVSASKALDLGFKFKFSDLDSALTSIYR